ncbi:low molecular weight protein-tyrosine-phosphatase [Chitinimonas sp.]|uniref:low molecular weight protein-tyrosine-phosphatase n=1 Tax=Chitinimonas sp. TaxID=1934313 RepID=UPI0035B49E89
MKHTIHAILFCCMGNICRSPTAEAVFRQRMQAAGLQLEVDSAGTDAYHSGEAPDRRSQKHAAARGYDLSGQRARQVRDADFLHYDLIVAMDRHNLAMLRARCPAEHRHKLHLMLGFGQLDPGGEVPDPYYDGDAGFERVLDLIEDACDGLLGRLSTG